MVKRGNSYVAGRDDVRTFVKEKTFYWGFYSHCFSGRD